MTQKRSAAHNAAQIAGRKRDLGICQICGSPIRPEGHHVIEYHYGGAANADNIVTLCHRCHRLVHAGKIDLLHG